MGKSLFNFYLDDEKKRKLTEKLVRLNGQQSKGQLASLIRVQLDIFLATPDDKVNPNLKELVLAELEFTTKCNKRSQL